MRPYLRNKSIVFFYLFFLSGIAEGQVFRNELGATADNDVYMSYRYDRYYTQGLGFYFRHALGNPKQGPEKIAQKRYVDKKILELGVGQKIYTPYSSYAPDARTHDRPFTAYLYSNASLGFFYENESVLKFVVESGIMGPHALGKEAQTAFHQLFNMSPVRGWEHQLRQEIKLNTQVTYDRLLYRGLKSHFDVAGQSSLSLGNSYSGISAGALARIGMANPLFQSVSHHSRISHASCPELNPDTNSRAKAEIFIFVRPQISYVAYNATIEGPLFLSDKGPVTFPSQRFVYIQQFGLEVAQNHWSAKYIVSLLSKETPKAKRSYYASINLGYSF